MTITRTYVVTITTEATANRSTIDHAFTSRIRAGLDVQPDDYSFIGIQTVPSERSENALRDDLTDLVDLALGEGTDKDLHTEIDRIVARHAGLPDGPWQADLRALLDYSWSSEERDYAENPDERHVFRSIQRLDRFLSAVQRGDVTP